MTAHSAGAPDRSNPTPPAEGANLEIDGSPADHARSLLHLLYGNGVGQEAYIVLSSAHAGTFRGQGGYPPECIDDLIDDALGLAQQGHDVYFGVYPQGAAPPSPKRGSARSAVVATTLIADVDG